MPIVVIVSCDMPNLEIHAIDAKQSSSHEHFLDAALGTWDGHTLTIDHHTNCKMKDRGAAILKDTKFQIAGKYFAGEYQEFVKGPQLPDNRAHALVDWKKELKLKSFSENGKCVFGS